MIRMEECRRIEEVRAEVLKARGLEAGEARISMHASAEAGGQGHRHAYQYAVAALASQFDEALHAQRGSPERTAMWAHVRNEYLRLGWDGRGRMLEWHPTWVQTQLSEERVVHAWLLGRLRMGLRIVYGYGAGDEWRRTNGARGRSRAWGRRYGGPNRRGTSGSRHTARSWRPG